VFLILIDRYLKQEYPHIQTDVYLEKIPETFRLIKGTDEVRSEVNNNETPYRCNRHPGGRVRPGQFFSSLSAALLNQFFYYS